MSRVACQRCCGSSLLAVTVILASALSLSGCVPRNASISKMTPVGSPGRARCWTTLEFEKELTQGDPMDVKVVCTAGALPNPVTFDWAYLTKNAFVRREGGRGRVAADKSILSGDKKPPLGYPFDLCFPLDIRLQVDSDRDLIITGKLYWGGKYQGKTRCNIRHLYKSG